ncbi:two-component system OmpR family sensor kinase [Diaminobutyricimonas aerilata]|uniref:histidine kinase n=1 Tax=Diaminobutyricimonas aerilata TaxID=1162967 RepID=A0A2M9CGJ6_9MICO|nr:ATP-binding protein [Diaminobutyricimonas aerilata]PJJ70998.1 two-component system OmpR family sensor kinase [Diaminobutyricimonas aerilata]
MTRRAPWSLQARLIVGIVALLAITSAIVGAVSATVLQGQLVGRLDAQLASAVRQASSALSGDPASPPQVRRLLPAQAAGALALVAVDGTIVSAEYIGAEGSGTTLSVEQQRTLLGAEADGRPVTASLGGDLGDYRLATVRVGPNAQLVVGLPLGDVQTTIGQLVLTIVLVTAAALVLAIGLGIVVVRLALRPLDRVMSTATRVAELPLDRGEVALSERVPEHDTDPRTEVGKVGAAFNRMLDHVASALTARQRSEDKVRRFVADASHELRTPLTAIRGYAELTRRAPHDLPEDVTRSLARIESESVRMTRLVEDLLLLARLDEGREVRADAVDMGPLLVDAVSDAHAAAPEHEWELDVPEEPVLVTGDAERLHQVVANLLANARAHTPPGTRVVVALTGRAGEAEITVTDDGPGIDAALVPNLFERFVRGDDSRSRRAGSTGLGLAIVRAIVDAHHGAVAVESVPGRTVFRVTLPTASREPAGA